MELIDKVKRKKKTKTDKSKVPKREREGKVEKMCLEGGEW